ncbi:MAG TPA: tetratricopeptide repeat protein [Anaeromyxobacteraceae bacterium]|nr:tetratricopeptide repeat protein [Anaeromyxobacteraceae bacterium]
MIVLVLSLALSAAAPAKGAPPKKGPAASQPAAQPAAAPAADPAAEETALQPLDAETMAFLASGGATNSVDGSVRLDWPGPGGNQLKLSWDSLDKRNEEVQTAEMLRISLVGAVQSFYDGDGTIDTNGMRAKLKALLTGPVDEARTAYLNAVKLEERRLFFVERGMAEAAAAKEELPGVDGRLVSKRLTAIRDGRIAAEVQNRVNGYRSLAVGLLAYLDGDTFGALNNVREASGGLKDVAVVHALLGSLYALYGQTDAAVTSWKRSLELDPSNRAVREAILQHSPKTRSGR